MYLSRREFFRGLWTPPNRPSRARQERYQVLQTYARTALMPFDFTLTGNQETELLNATQEILDKAPDDILMSNEILTRIETMFAEKLEPWRQRSLAEAQTDKLQEIRQAALDYVSAFLTYEPPATVDQLKQRFDRFDVRELEAEVQERIKEWIWDMDAEHLLQYDIISIRDLVFARLRSWC